MSAQMSIFARELYREDDRPNFWNRDAGLYDGYVAAVRDAKRVKLGA